MHRGLRRVDVNICRGKQELGVLAEHSRVEVEGNTAPEVREENAIISIRKKMKTD